MGPATTTPKAVRGAQLGGSALGRHRKEAWSRLAEELIQEQIDGLGSAVALDVEDLDLDAGEARPQCCKGDGRQTVLLPRGLCEHLRDYLGDRTAGPLFMGREGARISIRHVQRRVALWLERAGVNRRATVHSLRHRFAIRLYQRTGDIYLVQQALGHRSIASTTVYASADRDRLAAALG